jgi:hypothetical protein
MSCSYDRKAFVKEAPAMQPLEAFLSEQGERTIQTLARYIQQYIKEQWQQVFQQSREELLRLYDQAGEGAAYGTYALRLFRPIQQQFKQAGFLSSPSFPGTLNTSREWGPMNERERWMWSVVRPTDGAPIGALVIRLVHDHTRFRLPRPPGILAIEEVDTAAIVQAVAAAAGYPPGEGK